MRIPSFAKDGPVLGAGLCVDGRLSRRSLFAPTWSSGDQSEHRLAPKKILSFLSSFGGGGVGNLTAPRSPRPSLVFLPVGLSARGAGMVLACHGSVQRARSSDGRERFVQDFEAAPPWRVPGPDPGGACPHAHLLLGRWGCRASRRGQSINAGPLATEPGALQDGGQRVPDALPGGGGRRAPGPVRRWRGSARVAALHRRHPQPHSRVQVLAARAAAPARLPASARRGLRHWVSLAGGQGSGPGLQDCGPTRPGSLRRLDQEQCLHGQIGQAGARGRRTGGCQDQAESEGVGAAGGNAVRPPGSARAGRWATAAGDPSLDPA